MLDHDTRLAILRLKQAGQSARAIAKALGVSRRSVDKVLDSGSTTPTFRGRPCAAEPHLERIRELYRKTNGNLVRVHEELA
ncbi:MAG: helix-turn-helix domain-containing protein, partial [Candidatus Schekmanbacteria bacterium]|nr:helix-turn-helix domain-containing protein [Candidatus Schekmanbacteria bacterium]